MNSSNTRDATMATVATLVLLGFGCLFCAPFLHAGYLNPLTPIVSIQDMDYRAASKSYWISLVVSQAAVWIVFWLFGRGFSKRWRVNQEFEVSVPIYTVALQTVPPTTTPFSANDKPERPQHDIWGTPKWFEGNPVTWLTLREMSMHASTWVFTFAAFLCTIGAFSPVGLFYSILYSFGLVIFLCIASCRTFAVARQSNSMELLITTPLGIEGVIEGHLAALRKIFLLPSAIMLVTFTIYLLQRTFREVLWNLDLFGRRMTGFEWYLLAAFGMLLVATPWIGMWMGLRSKSPARAIMATIGMVFILPRFGFCYLIDPFYFLAMWIIARNRVHRRFRQLITERFSPT